MTDPYKYEANHVNFDMNDPVQVWCKRRLDIAAILDEL